MQLQERCGSFLKARAQANILSISSRPAVVPLTWRVVVFDGERLLWRAGPVRRVPHASAADDGSRGERRARATGGIRISVGISGAAPLLLG